MLDQHQRTLLLNTLRGYRPSVRVNHLREDIKSDIRNIFPYEYSISSFDRVGHVVELLETLTN